ncbi:Rrf2 family protein [Paraburkholderia sp. RAU6.4a]|uniref:Rrf2 family transcriptional regulator n=1 Tax=Paraburkholderia sp. RAU6.4a TaxID=2991067 RepID=UPI003D24CDC8
MALTNVQFSVAAHILAVLGYHYGREVTSAVLAESVNAEPTFIRRALSKLSKAGLVTATRGRNGACVLARAPGKISLLDIYLASEAPPTFAVHGYPVEKACPISSNIKGSMTDVFEKAQAGFEKSLSQQTLADVIANIRKGEVKTTAKTQRRAVTK